MAACGSLQRLFDKENPSLLDPFSPWKAIKNMKPIHNASFNEIFGELHHHHRHHVHESSSPSSPTPISVGDDGRRSESSDCDEKKVKKMSRQSSTSSSKRSRRTHDKGTFPPPISCIGRRTGKPWVCFRSYREDGRFILQEIRFPTQEILHACREDGRLRLQYIQSDEENLESSDEEDEEDEEDDVVGVETSGNISDVRE